MLSYAPPLNLSSADRRHSVFEPGNALAVTWLEVLHGIFPVLGRLASLAGCCDRQTGRYQHENLANKLGPEQADYGMRVAHTLVWRDWMSASLEEQHSDIFFYLRSLSSDVESLISIWLHSKPFLEYAPHSAGQEERSVYASNLVFLLERSQRESCCSTRSTRFEMQRFVPGALDSVLSVVHKHYADPALSLKILSAQIGVCERHMGRQFRAIAGKTFRQYLRELRIREASKLLGYSRRDVKVIAAQVGYCDQSHFCEDFRGLMGCTPLEFRTRFASTSKSTI